MQRVAREFDSSLRIIDVCHGTPKTIKIAISSRQLLRLDAYLHERTDGMIGSLSHLIRGAAVEAILDGSEKITRETLDRVGLDHAAEAARTRRKTTARRRRDSAR